MATIGDRIRATRERLGISQSDLADRVGVRQPTMWRYETQGMAPGPDVLVALARELRVTEHWLMHGEEAPPVADDEPDPPLFAEFLARYEHAKDLTPDDLRAMKAYVGRTHRVLTWTDWVSLAEWRRTRTVVVAPSAPRSRAASVADDADDADADDAEGGTDGPPIDPYGGPRIDPYKGRR